MPGKCEDESTDSADAKHNSCLEASECVHFMPPLLDPRYKLNLVEFSFAELRDFETAKALISNVKETLTKLFEHYHFTLLYSSRTGSLF